MRGTPEELSLDAAGEVRARYRDNLPRHLIGISRDLQGRVMRSLSEQRGYAGLRMSFGPVLSLLWNEGRPLRELASELAISKQACSQLSNAIEAAGYLERRPNPRDRRSKLVCMTRRGRTLARQGAQLIVETEAVYAALVPAREYRRFTTSLVHLYRGLELPVHALDAAPVRQRRSAALLPLIVERIQRRLMEATAGRGYRGLKMSHGQVLPFIGPAGGRIGEIARIQGASRQSVSAISQDLERLGYLARGSDAVDRRAVVLTLTPRGRALIRASVAAVDELDAHFEQWLGASTLRHLERVAHELYHALHIEAEIFERPAVVAADRKIEQLAATLRRRLHGGEAAQLAARLAQPLEPQNRTSKRNAS